MPLTNETHQLKPCPHCRRKVRLSQKSATVAEKWDCRRKVWLSPNSATVTLFCDSLTFLRRYSRTFLRQCGQGLTDIIQTHRLHTTHSFADNAVLSLCKHQWTQCIQSVWMQIWCWIRWNTRQNRVFQVTKYSAWLLQINNVTHTTSFNILCITANTILHCFNNLILPTVIP